MTKPIHELIIGLPLNDARTLCLYYGYKLRVAKQDGEPYLLTCDYNSKRVNVEVEDGNVVNFLNFG